MIYNKYLYIYIYTYILVYVCDDSVQIEFTIQFNVLIELVIRNSPSNQSVEQFNRQNLFEHRRTAAPRRRAASAKASCCERAPRRLRRGVGASAPKPRRSL